MLFGLLNYLRPYYKRNHRWFFLFYEQHDVKRPFRNFKFCSRSRTAKILTVRIHVFCGLKFEPDTEIELERKFCNKVLAFIHKFTPEAFSAIYINFNLDLEEVLKDEFKNGIPFC
jgi:hypothetical protein